MSRRKQSNPKPIKRSSEENDCVDQPETEIFPNSDFTLTKFGDNSEGVTTQSVIKKGTKYGPYIVGEYNENCESVSFTLSIGEDEDLKLNLLDEMGSWIKCIKQTKDKELSNAYILKKENRIWLSIFKDMEPGTELVAKYSAEIIEESHSSDEEDSRFICVKVEPHSPESIFHNKDGQESVAKASSEDITAEDMSMVHLMKGDALSTSDPSISCPILKGHKIMCINGEVWQQQGKMADMADELRINDGNDSSQDRFQFICSPCGIVFSSRSTLLAHQSIYCIHRKREDDIKEETEDEISTEGRSRATRKDCKINGFNKRSRDDDFSSSSPDDIEAKSRKSGQIYSCIYCSYTADKKSSLNRHMRMHSSPPPVNKTIIDNQVLAAAMAERQLVLMQSYCAECDIQFTSHKNFAVHKQIYCNTRRVQPRSSHSNNNQSSRVKSPAAHASSSIPTIDHSAIASWNFFQKNAFSSSPLILVPCSYIPGRGLVPASSLMLKNGEDFLTNVNHHDVMPSNNSITRTNSLSPIKGSGLKRVEISQDILEPSENLGGSKEKPMQHLSESASSDSENSLKNSSSLKHKLLTRNGIISKEYHNSSDYTDSRFFEDSQSVPADSPLDLSVSKPCKNNDLEENEKENCNVMNNTITSPNIDVKREIDTPTPSGEYRIPLSGPEIQHDESSRSTPNGPKAEMPHRERAALPVIVKQGVSNCAECNIVFYKHENYLAHKKFYCSARADKLLPLPSDSRKQAKSRNSLKNSSKMSDAVDSQNQACSNRPLVQFFCVPCGIKFSSIKNLHAHQVYYCPKRDSTTSNEENITESPTSPVDVQIPSAFNCADCKSSFTSDLALQRHLCSHCIPRADKSPSPQLHGSPPAFIRIPQEKQSNALRCIVCGYRGHTLRGMKSHVRSHMSQIENASAILEEDVYAFVVHEKFMHHLGNHDINENSDGFMLKSITNGTDKATLSVNAAIQSQYVSGELWYYCGLCSYTSSYRGNVARHRRFVHKDKIEALELINNGFEDKNLKNGSKSEDENGVCSPPIRANSTHSSDGIKTVIKNSGNSSGEESVSDADRNGKPKIFCKNCHISFSYLPSYIAHKQFYCTERDTDGNVLDEK